MIKAGVPTIKLINTLIPLLEKDDIIIDGGNSHFKNTSELEKKLEKYSIRLIGCGISGGETGALNGPAIMPGGSKSAYKEVRRYFEAIAAKDKNGDPCCSYIGKGGAGHFVKMVHNGIEYAEMQLLAEVYQTLECFKGFNPGQVAEVLEEWQNQEVSGYLLEITAGILKRKEDSGWLINQILDKAGNKGTGSWTTIAAAELGVPVPTITAALYARYISELKEERIIANNLYDFNISPENRLSTHTIRKAYQLARIINHHQGFHLMKAASMEYGWELNLAEIARIWTNGCIIRSKLMEDLIAIISETHSILLSPALKSTVQEAKGELSEVISKSITTGLHIPCFTTALNYLIGYSTARSSANIIQAQRDYFGAHTYQRIDDPSGESRHTNWNN